MRKRFVYALSAITALLLATAIASANPAKPGVHSFEDVSACRSSVHDSMIKLQELPSKKAVKEKINLKNSESAAKNLPTAVIVVGFEGNRTPVAYNNNYDWGRTLFTQDASLTNYYNDMSFGQFTFAPVRESSAYGVDGNTNVNDKANDGVIHVNVPYNHDNWLFVDDNDHYHNSTLSTVLDRAFKEADKHLDFSMYDSNNDGIVQNNEMGLVVLMAGYEGSSSSNYSDGKNKYTWAFMMEMSEFADDNVDVPTADHVGFESFVTMGEQHDRESSYEQGYVSTLAHELGHYLGLPDLYATGSYTSRRWSNYDVDYLSLMASGSWGTDPSGNNVPYSLDAWSKYALGWIQPQRVVNNGTYDINYSESHDEYKTIKIDTQRPDEYYLLENRQPEKWDAGMRNNKSTGFTEGGIILWHIDNGIYQHHKDTNTINSVNHRPGIMPLYGETKTGNLSTMIGTKVRTDQGFFDKSLWSSEFAANDGREMNLPLYPSSEVIDIPRNRSWSGLFLDFLTDNGHEMKVGFNNDNHVHFMIHTPAKASTCNKKGNIEYWQCSYCKKYYTDSNGNNEILINDLNKRNAAFSYASHTWGEGLITKQATSSSEGEMKYECTVCGASKTEKISKLPSKGPTQNEIEKELKKMNSDKSLPESKFAPLMLRSSKQSKKSIVLKWAKINGARKYIIFGNRCNAGNKKFKLEKIATTSKSSFTIKKAKKALKKQTYYKFVVIAVDDPTNTSNSDGAKVDATVLSISKLIHVSTRGSKKKGNPKSIKVLSKSGRSGQKLKKYKTASSFNIKAGRTIKLKATAKLSKRTKFQKHAGIGFESSNASVATVSTSGKIKSKRSGSCYIYAYAQNGVYKRITINVKK